MFPYINIFNKAVPMYGICIVIGILAASGLIIFDCRKRGILWEDAVIIGVTGLGAGLLGAKVLYVLITFTPAEIIEIVKKGEWKYILSGGFVFYGGLICGMFGALFGAFLAKSKLAVYENVLVKVIPLVHGFGRIGCLFAGCCYGRPSDSGFGVVFRNPISDAPVGVPLIPIQIYEAIFNFVLFVVLWGMDKKYPKNRILLPVYILCYSVERFFVEFFRYDAARGFLFALSTSQWISIGLFAAGMIMVIVRLKKKDAKPASLE